MHRSHLTRRATLQAAGVLALPGVALAAAAPTVTMLGDSLTAGYGLARQDSLPAQLQSALRRLGVDAVIRGAGVNGDTTAGALARLERAVPADTDICVVALGGNDLLQIADPRAVRANLDQIIRRLKRRGVEVVLVGIAAPPELGPYARTFDGVFAELARQHRVRFYPDILAGVARNRVLNQSDGIHPNARGVAVIAERLAPVVKAAIRG